MLQFFRGNQFFAGFLLIFYALFLRLPVWWQAADTHARADTEAGVWGKLLENWALTAPNWALTLAILLVFLTALVANQIVGQERLSRNTNQFAGLFFILLASLFPALLGLPAISLANFFLLLSLWSAFGLYQTNDTAKAAFNAGFWLGIACLFHSSFSVYLLLLFMAAAILNSLSFKLLLRIVFGWATVLWLAAAYYFGQQQLPYFRETQQLNWYLPNFESAALWDFGGIVILSSVLGFVLFKQAKNVQLLHIEGQKKVNLLYWWLFFSACLLFFSASVSTINVLPLLLPMGILLSFTFGRAGKQAAEAGHLLLLLIALALNCWPFFIPSP